MFSIWILEFYDEKSNPGRLYTVARSANEAREQLLKAWDQCTLDQDLLSASAPDLSTWDENVSVTVPQDATGQYWHKYATMEEAIENAWLSQSIQPIFVRASNL